MAGMAQDSTAQLRVWHSTAMLAHQRHERGEGLAVSQAAQATTAARRNPLFSSLAHARTAIGHASRGDRQPALRSLGHAEAALAKAPANVLLSHSGTAPVADFGIVQAALGRPEASGW
ncbi:hypothetical protein ACGFX2_39885 [Streptomyces goshikiensis]|uniref:hypothetical protein n=1 Tax=Streptomyces goshikiensis TaxID=1942 RepID=UPI003724017B